MTTIADLRERLRIDLHDESAARWQDDVLDRHLQRAAAALSLAWPREVTSVLQATPGSRDIDIASLAGLVRVRAVAYPAQLYPPSFVPFSVYAGTLSMHLDEAPSLAEDVAVHWGGLHVVDEAGSTLPAAAEDIVVMGAAGYAAVEWASFATNRANIGGREAGHDYLTWGEHQLKRFDAALGRLGDRGRVRTSRLQPALRRRTSRGASLPWEA